MPFVPQRGPPRVYLTSFAWAVEVSRPTSITPKARTALDAQLRRMRELDLPGIGDAPLFPSPEDPSEPEDRYVASRWLRTAEEEAELEGHDGSL